MQGWCSGDGSAVSTSVPCVVQGELPLMLLRVSWGLPLWGHSVAAHWELIFSLFIFYFIFFLSPGKPHERQVAACAVEGLLWAKQNKIIKD